MPEIEVVVDNGDGSDDCWNASLCKGVPHAERGVRPTSSRRCSRAGSRRTVKEVAVELRCVGMGLGGSFFQYFFSLFLSISGK
ncbi:hypothetical protein C1H46_009892 [Malus baccata]|uniref:Uncharacterized protein n=1 Tax=Malus baccata TaxID=106549 RepID=A0A540N0A8_MALBA|nr:hypothetical protein C1H46_009892 [Malus baccata]